MFSRRGSALLLDTARLRLTVWYTLLVTVPIGVLSLALYRLVPQVQQGDLHDVATREHHVLAHIFAHDRLVLASQIMAVDTSLLLVAALASYILAGRTLGQVRDVLERQRRFAAAASHELRTPLTSLRGAVDVALLSRRTPEEYEQVLRDTAARAERMSALVQDLTLLARPISDAALVRRDRVDLTGIARVACEWLHPQAESRGQVITLDLPPTLPVHGDRLKLQQAVTNLLENASTYSPPGSTIRVWGESSVRGCTLRVADSGPGIPPKHLPHLFEPFYRADGARAGADHAGLGLALVDWIARAHGGSVDVETSAGHGSTFTLSIPTASDRRYTSH